MFNRFSFPKRPFSRIKNAIMAYCGYSISILKKKPTVMGMPFLFAIEPTNFCNLHCVECPSGNGSLKRKRQEISTDLYKTILQKIEPYALYLTLYFQGEPLLHKDFATFVRLAHEKNIFTATSTNGQLLTTEKATEIVAAGLDKLIISIDGTTQETYGKYRIGGQLEKAVAAVKAVTKAKKKLRSNTPFVEIQFLVFKHNEHQIPEIKKLVKELKADKLSLKTAQIYDYKKGSELIPNQKKYARYVSDSGEYKLKRNLKNRCYRLFTGVTVCANGDVIPCSFDKDALFSYGNLKNQSLEEIWRSDKAQHFRERIFSDRKSCGICRNCVY